VFKRWVFQTAFGGTETRRKSRTMHILSTDTVVELTVAIKFLSNACSSMSILVLLLPFGHFVSTSAKITCLPSCIPRMPVLRKGGLYNSSVTASITLVIVAYFLSAATASTAVSLPRQMVSTRYSSTSANVPTVPIWTLSTLH
jgi:hypothetical protein